MRLDEMFLLEYDRSKTALNYGQRLLVKFRKDKSKVAQMLQKNVKETGDTSDKYLIDRILTYIEAYDPTPNKEYVQWLCRLYISDGIPMLEDLGKAKSGLTEFHNLKTSGYFKRNRDQATFADIYRFRTLNWLADFLERAGPAESSISNNAVDKIMETKFFESGAAELMYNDENFKVVVPHSTAASCFFGRNTRWCTAAKEDNQFDNYDNRLFIVLHKPTNRRWQLCPGDDQYMDERDNAIVWDRFPTEIFSLCDFKLTGSEKIGVILFGPKGWAEHELKSASKDALAAVAVSASGGEYDLSEYASRFDIEPRRTVDLPYEGGNEKVKIVDFGNDLQSMILWVVKNSTMRRHTRTRRLLMNIGGINALRDREFRVCRRAILIIDDKMDGDWCFAWKQGNLFYKVGDSISDSNDTIQKMPYPYYAWGLLVQDYLDNIEPPR